MFANVLVALDGSPQSRKVLELACSLAGPETRLHAVCVVDPAYALPASRDDWDCEQYPAATQQQQHAEQLVEEARQQALHQGLDCSPRTLSGQPAEAICEQARLLECDLIVIGHWHLSWLGRLTDPSVGSQVLDNAPCPVLVEVR